MISTFASGFRFFENDETRSVGIIFQDQNFNTTQLIRARFSPHSIVGCRALHNQFLFFDKGKNVSGHLNLSSQDNTITYIRSTPGCVFYGHGFYLPEGTAYVATERTENYGGKVVIRDSRTHQVLEQYTLNSLGPHDCLLMNDDKTIILTQSGILGEEGIGKITGTGEISFLDLNSGKLLDSMKPDRKDLAPGHVSISSQGHIALLLASEDNSINPSGLIAIGKIGGTLKTLYGPSEIHQRKSDFTLSVLIDEARSRVITTDTWACTVTCWDLNTGEFISHLKIPSPLGLNISDDGKHYVVSGAAGFIFQICCTHLTLSRMLTTPETGSYEAHLSKIKISSP